MDNDGGTLPNRDRPGRFKMCAADDACAELARMLAAVHFPDNWPGLDR